ncbi:hypothetical protein B0O80DRAFT_254968 [Mortierella sp. GBAus27b]|nr:hypothetical protein B0O80DRAFT_254968 [Mortierella sp. GBAus27b]
MRMRQEHLRMRSPNLLLSKEFDGEPGGVVDDGAGPKKDGVCCGFCGLCESSACPCACRSLKECCFWCGSWISSSEVLSCCPPTAICSEEEVF